MTIGLAFGMDWRMDYPYKDKRMRTRAQFERGFTRILADNKPITVLWGKVVSIRPKESEWSVTIDAGIDNSHNFINFWVDEIQNINSDI